MLMELRAQLAQGQNRAPPPTSSLVHSAESGAESPFPGAVLPAPLVGRPTDSFITGDSLTLAQQSENGLTAAGYPELISGGTGRPARFPTNASATWTHLQPFRFS